MAFLASCIGLGDICLNKNKHSLGKIDEALESTKQDISYLKFRESKGDLYESDGLQLSCLYNRYIMQINLKLWSQAKIKWIGDGDQNIKYYHVVVT